MKIGNIFQVSRQFNMKKLSELFHYDHSLLYSESWTNILHSHSLLLNLGNRHSFNSLPELDFQLIKKVLHAQKSETPNHREQNMVSSFVESSLTVDLV